MVSSNFTGIFYSLYEQRRTEVRKYIKVIASSTLGGRGDSYSVVDPDIIGDTDEKSWISNDKENSSITIYFKRDRITPKSYSIRSRLNTDAHMPLEWILEASDDNVNWYFLHHKERNEEFTVKGFEKKFELVNSNNFRYIRITQIGENSKAGQIYPHCFAFDKIELFGSLSSIRITCRVNRNRSIIHVLVLSIYFS